MKKILFGAVLVSTFFVSPLGAFAQESLVVNEPILEPTGSSEKIVIVDALKQEIASLRIREKESNFITGFWIRLKIQELENKLNIRKALQ